MFALSFASIIQLMTVNVLDNALKVAVYCFALSIPLLAITLYIKIEEEVVEQFFTSRIFQILGFRSI